VFPTITLPNRDGAWSKPRLSFSTFLLIREKQLEMQRLRGLGSLYVNGAYWANMGDPRKMNECGNFSEIDNA